MVTRGKLEQGSPDTSAVKVTGWAFFNAIPLTWRLGRFPSSPEMTQWPVSRPYLRTGRSPFVDISSFVRETHAWEEGSEKLKGVKPRL